MRGVKLKLILEEQVSAALCLAHVRCRCKFRCIDERIKKYNHVFFGIKELQGPSSL